MQTSLKHVEGCNQVVFCCITQFDSYCWHKTAYFLFQESRVPGPKTENRKEATHLCECESLEKTKPATQTQNILNGDDLQMGSPQGRDDKSSHDKTKVVFCIAADESHVC